MAIYGNKQYSGDYSNSAPVDNSFNLDWLNSFGSNNGNNNIAGNFGQSGFKPGDKTNWANYMQQAGINNNAFDLNMKSIDSGGGNWFGDMFGKAQSGDFGTLQGWGSVLNGVGQLANYGLAKDMAARADEQFKVKTEFAQAQFDEQKRLNDKREGRMDRGRAGLGFA